jgi:MoaA/NifB/PqqE/SkfB family radical SAM enzyme
VAIARKIETTGFRMLCALPRPVRRLAAGFVGRIRKYRAFSLKSPVNLTVYITSRCNARCSHCFYWREIQDNTPDELSIDNYCRIASTLRHPLSTLMLTGGEPLLRKDLHEICDVFFQKNLTRRITIASNGFLKNTADIISYIARRWPSRIVHVQISLDGHSDIHNSIRGLTDGYEKAINAIEELVAQSRNLKNIDVSIMTTICMLNVKDVIPFSRTVAEIFPGVLHKFNIIRGSHFGTIGLPESITSDLDPNPDTAQTVSVNKLIELFRHIDQFAFSHEDPIWQVFQKLKWEYSIQLLRNLPMAMQCMAGYSFGVIYQDGSVALCEPTRPFANLRDFGFDFHRLWHSEEANLMRHATVKCACIHPCNVLDSLSFDGKAISRAVEMYCSNHK